MAVPQRTTGSLWPTFVSARLVSLAVRRAYAIALDERFPTVLSLPSHASVTLWEATAPVKLPTMRCPDRSEEHTSELQSRRDLVCRLLLEKKKNDLRGSACCNGRWTYLMRTGLPS